MKALKPDFMKYFTKVPKHSGHKAKEWIVVPLHHIYGSEKRSMLSPAVAELAPRPYLALNAEDIRHLKIAEGDMIALIGKTDRSAGAACQAGGFLAKRRCRPALRTAWYEAVRLFGEMQDRDGMEGPTMNTLIGIIIPLGVLFSVLTVAAGLIWLERRLLAFWQDRYGPNRVGAYGLLQPLADAIKLMFKEDWVPPFSDKPVFILAPVVIVITVVLAFAVIPFAPGIVVVDLNVGLLFFLGMSSLGVYSVVLGGWASNSKYSLLGGLRASAQMLSYEVFMGISVMGVVMMAGSFNLGDIVEAQRIGWFWIPQFFGMVIFIIAGTRRDASPPLRPARGRERTRSRVPFGIFRNEVRALLCRRIYRHHAGLRDDRNALFRRMARPFSAAHRLVHHKDFFIHLRFHTAQGDYAKTALRSAHVIRLEDTTADCHGKPAFNRRVVIGSNVGAVREPPE